MGQIKGQMEYQKFKKGKSLTYRQAILAQCYSCNGLNESAADCQGHNCTLYPYSPYGDEDNYPYSPKKGKGNIVNLQKKIVKSPERL